MSGGSWAAEAERIRALAPRHVLFLCVANSARSQMAEAIARRLAPPQVTISSAGSRPSAVNPYAVRALDEIGIDLRGHRSKSVDEVDPSRVDVVVTLCAEEVCPAFLGEAHRVHWALPDPAAVAGAEEERLAAFRDVRDELRRRLAVVFADPAPEWTLEAARPDDLTPVRSLLAELGLPAADVGAENQRFVVARAGGELVGCAALELYGTGALLRSLAVRSTAQGRGLGRALYGRVMADAARAGVTDVFLLTTTADRFFARQGFRRVAREDVPDAVRASAEFASLCPATAACMARRVE